MTHEDKRIWSGKADTMEKSDSVVRNPLTGGVVVSKSIQAHGEMASNLAPPDTGPAGVTAALASAAATTAETTAIWSYASDHMLNVTVI